ncbi:MAG: nucleotidyl transferase AbiEii/AbiGii toxin family protein [Caldilineaceae bacterium]
MEIQDFYRSATAEEITYYQEVLYPLQDVVFAIVRVYEQKLYLTGGTALARCYFHHRLSEDLDFLLQPMTSSSLRMVCGCV